MKLKSLFLVVCVMSLTSCGGSSGNVPSPSDFIDRSGITTGAVSGFGSVIVNGVAYETANATFTIDDQPGQESSLSVGQIVVINGIVDGVGVGTANSVTTDPSVKGQIESVDLVTNTFSVLGTNVIVSGSTLFGQDITPSTLASLVVDDRVEVYGLRNANADLVATLIRRTTDQELELNGRVSALDQGAMSFALGNQTIDFSNAQLVGFSATISDGDLVEVESSSLDGSGVLLAGRVEFEGATELSAEDEGTEVELEGFVTRFVSPEDFDVNGVASTTNSTTEFEGGSLDALQLDARLEIEGVVNASGVLVADKIEFEAESNLELEATVESVDAINGQVTLLGITFTTTPLTQFIDESDAEVRRFSLDDVIIGDWIEVDAFADANGVQLNLFERKNPEDRLRLEGLVSQVSAPSVFVNAAEILTNASTVFEIDDLEVTEAEFFSTVAPDQEVSAEGLTFSAGVLTADNIEI